MKVLWFEVTEPSAYKSGGAPLGGWQDSLERIVRTIPDVELTIAFVSEENRGAKFIDGIEYVPIFFQTSIFERVFKKPWDCFANKVIPEAINIIKKINPDIIHIFGTEWPYGQIASKVNVPVVIHIMGAMVPYNNAGYPPGYSFFEIIMTNWWNPKRLLNLCMGERHNQNREVWEKKTWKIVDNYMGRTSWDDSLSRILHPGRRYFHVDEALRKTFIECDIHWQIPSSSKIKLVSTGISSFWKGPDMMLKVGRILTELKVDFEWNVVGSLNEDIKYIVEHKEGISFKDLNINILGFKQPEEITKLLCSSTLYVHTAYIENSPNSICEAQCLGVPIVSTNVGGISTLLKDGKGGILVPSNDPWQMADAIIQLASDVEKMNSFSKYNREIAISRHNDENIKNQLLQCYQALIRK